MAASTQSLVHEALLGEAAASARVAIFLNDDTLTYVAVNDAACELVGCSREELLRLHVDDVVERPAPALADAAREVADGRVRSGASSIRRRDGSSQPVQYVSIPASVAGLPYALTVVW